MLSVFLGTLLCFTADAVELGSLKSTPPADWKEGRAGAMQLKSYTLPKAEGDSDPTTLTIYQFPGGVGSLDNNLKRWKGMIDPGKGKAIDDVAKIENFEVSKIKVTSFDASGTYLFRPNMQDPNTVVKKENYRLINIFFPADDKVYTMRLVGPAKSVAAAEKGFMEWVKNFK
jgi:hypothetical protein